ncbi:MAG: hypothetical protein SFT68_00180, partial [Rickettsiaceae bacterium]|nr:hypothetical protein [Rickettsiaceae bacterium]
FREYIVPVIRDFAYKYESSVKKPVKPYGGGNKKGGNTIAPKDNIKYHAKSPPFIKSTKPLSNKTVKKVSNANIEKHKAIENILSNKKGKIKSSSPKKTKISKEIPNGINHKIDQNHLIFLSTKKRDKTSNQRLTSESFANVTLI